ncbi:MAG: hypothetical protein HRF44_07345 [Ignavibacterium sp.]|jgi:hypothetical protein
MTLTVSCAAERNGRQRKMMIRPKRNPLTGRCELFGGESRGRFMVYGLWFMVYGLWFMVYGLWFMVLCGT